MSSDTELLLYPSPYCSPRYYLWYSTVIRITCMEEENESRHQQHQQPHQQQQQQPRPPSVVYEQLGAPTLLYRNIPAYAYDIHNYNDTTRSSNGTVLESAILAFQDSRDRLLRAQAKWYLHEHDDDDDDADNEDDNNNNKDDDDDSGADDDDDDDSPTESKDGLGLEGRGSSLLESRSSSNSSSSNNKNDNDNDNFNLSGIQAQAQVSRNKLSHIIRRSTRRRKQALKSILHVVDSSDRHSHGTQLSNALTKYPYTHDDDTPYVRAASAHTKAQRLPKKQYIQDSIVKWTRFYDQERCNRADPAYLAPFETNCLLRQQQRQRQSTRNDESETATKKTTTTTSADDSKTRSRPRQQQKLVFDRNHQDGPQRYGNCLVCFACTCPFCRHGSTKLSDNYKKSNAKTTRTTASASESVASDTSRLPSICLVHPVDSLLDYIRLSFLSLPRSQCSTSISSSSSTLKEKQEEEEDNNHGDDAKIKDLYIGDSVRQIHECGDLTFIARSDLFCTVFFIELCHPEITPSGKATKKKKKKKTNFAGSNVHEKECCRFGRLSKLYRIDLRSMARSIPSYRPVVLTCHPKYGRNNFTKSNIAILSETDVGSASRDRNSIHHVHCCKDGSSSPLVTKHYISNLQEILEIDFTSEHPMVLWAAARSYVRPTMVTNTVFKRPRIGYGSSLFTVDLRTNLATFQWSPSKEEFQIEGCHSLSGIFTDWTKPHSVWISSTSAGKTWEIDSRMPCKTLSSWMLSHSCDEPGVVLPSTAFYGAGTLFAQPISRKSFSLEVDRGPVITVGKSPGTFGLHILQRPSLGPRFQTDSIESAAIPAISSLCHGGSIALTSSFPLPDVSDGMFTCGLCSFQTPISSLVSVPDLIRLGFIEKEVDSALCTITMTNKGDLYAHSILESQASHRASRTFPGLPVGSSAVALSGSSSTSSRGVGTLSLSLCNEYPTPSSAFVPFGLESISQTIDPPLFSEHESDNTSSDEDDAEAVQLSEIKTANTIPSFAKGEAGTVFIQKEVHDRSKAQSLNILDFYKPPRLSAIQQREQKANLESLRADVSADIIQKASETWNSPDSDESDDGSSQQNAFL